MIDLLKVAQYLMEQQEKDADIGDEIANPNTVQIDKNRNVFISGVELEKVIEKMEKGNNHERD